ncbi:MAG: AAA-like domain-containing protein [Kouleothrix sp.]|nr:AAA-like domain-containing protein [Kouleothrix sp.]
MTPTRRLRVFISYKHDVSPDEPLARVLAAALRNTHDVFIDQDMLVGTRWAEQIRIELARSDALITLLSAQATESVMIKEEVELAHTLQCAQGRPLILPVRLNYRAPFPYPLRAYLDDRQWAFWQGEQDTPALIAALRRALAGGVLPLQSASEKADVLRPATAELLPAPAAMAQPSLHARTRPLEQPEGTMRVDSRFYIPRATDKRATESMAALGVTLTIKGPRQVGKSSLLMRVIDTAAAAGKRVAFLDFQLFDRAALATPDLFFRQFCAWLTDALDLEDRVDEYWSTKLGNSQRCTRYLERYLLKEIREPLMLALDEVESMFDADFRSDFFGMLRSWHNSRAAKPIWQRLDLALVTSTEPYQLIANLNQSPFNVGQVIALDNFTVEEAHALNELHEMPLTLGNEIRLFGLLSGHPYLTRRALYQVASGRDTAETLFANATAERGPFGDHLRYHLFRMQNQPDLVHGLLQVLQQGRCTNETVFWRLHGAGLVRGEFQRAHMRNRLYAEFFGIHFKRE